MSETAGYTIIDPTEGRLVIYTDEPSGRYDLIVRNEFGAKVATVPLTPDMLRNLGYAGALYYHKRTGNHALIPNRVQHPTRVLSEQPMNTTAAGAVRERVRRPAEVAPQPPPETVQPVARVRTRTRAPD